MVRISRFIGNPVIAPNGKNSWEARATFNPNPVFDGEKISLFYRAESNEQDIDGKKLILSTIGCAESIDRISFKNRRQLIVPEYDFEKYGCEDPRVTKIDDKFYIFYTALSRYPPTYLSIRTAVAISKNLKRIDEKHPVTPFNSKAMALFPKKINGMYAAILTVNTDLPPSKVGIAYFQNEEQIWDEIYWHNWYRKLDHYVLPLLRSSQDQVEVGAIPIETPEGWVLIYSYIKNYDSNDKVFGIEAVLLDLNNPLKIIGRTEEPLMVPEKEYEINGNVPNVIFPSGALVNNNELGIYYGGADTVSCLATCKLDDLISSLRHSEYVETLPVRGSAVFKRYSDNPIISPIPEHSWESKYTLNSAAFIADEKVFIVYRAMGESNTSVLGLAVSEDGVHITERLAEPIYVPREQFEIGPKNRFSGCEDPRITKIEDRLYMCYTAYDGINATRVALTSITLEDFLRRKWNWDLPVLISPSAKDDKNSCVLNERIEDKYVFLHRLSPNIWVDFKNDLKFNSNVWLGGQILMEPRVNMWDSEKIGIGPPPIKVGDAWILIYHAISRFDKQYRLGAALIDFSKDSKVISRLPYPILEPVAKYENTGLRPGTVFACGAIVKEDELFIYYGGADQYVCVASVSLSGLLDDLRQYIN